MSYIVIETFESTDRVEVSDFKIKKFRQERFTYFVLCGKIML